MNLPNANDIKTRADYEAVPALSYSGMKELLRSPRHYQHWLLNPREETKALRIGKATHAAFLTPDIFAKTYFAAPAVDRRTKEGKAAYEAFTSSLPPEAIVLPAEEHELCASLAIAASHICDNLLHRTGAWIERPLFAKDKATPIKGIPDFIDSQEGWIYDLKTTDDASERAALRTILSYGYHLQAAHYIRLAGANRTDIRGFRLIMVEKDAPHEGAVYEISGELLDLGNREVDRAYSLFDRCTRDNTWPGYSETPGNVTVLTDLPGSKAKASGGSTIAF